MIDIEICPLKAEHIDSVVAINNLSFPTPWSRESLEKEIEDNTIAKYVVAKKFNIVIGYAGIWCILDEGHITNIAIHPEYRGIGAGSLLLETLIEICKIEFITSMTLEVRKSNLIAQNLYKKYGFVQEGIRKAYYADNKEDAIIMWKHNI
ncbi:ribosomal protein S18-alanine N-acetyltransferase [Clostridium luticellarii]|jgi:ribosomal-protein-alanine N-acetyltransferase|uniref:[Ribosomal protein bS18]-alanine N-acetyltransferase n=1 Tax=Clostridium luticellarii TaxID=1691940 RepID=A0A2T0BND0_9CLOT|nr:ribosomal protein S18-alanine N-acetyltransferase [Clostridium luticellarii]MCI1945439.1 ribosomal protein S18-alanine N-acetyltransferase [Clostridium luticellarii]MCI1968772.1 ribosomal protein S18-alanine N-acetyltransferase [Clostridium luticellarii]MCI1994954.1 ribosomal protein S18-alanine N-acetyltransferase [Clostridium luticellarii]MCI2040199.1 ribosomal protein S18-alanine N-acetyltransferase [Clostridium luticellarii]PRR85363.1 ribosomal-protein-alanine N-acetyltransferase [Clost